MRYPARDTGSDNSFGSNFPNLRKFAQNLANFSKRWRPKLESLGAVRLSRALVISGKPAMGASAPTVVGTREGGGGGAREGVGCGPSDKNLATRYWGSVMSEMGASAPIVVGPREGGGVFLGGGEIVGRKIEL